MNPGEYEAWYQTARGRWIADREFDLMMRLLNPPTGATLLDVGCGTGHFSRRFATAGLRVAGLDPDPAMLEYAGRLGGGVNYLRGTATELPLPDGAYDYITAVTSLCFIPDAPGALREMWRVARRAVLLGLLNRRSLLYRRKHDRGAYRGARWDVSAELRRWAQTLEPAPRITVRSAIFLPGGGAFAHVAEAVLPDVLPWGGFLAVILRKPDHQIYSASQGN
ncbi:MAG: class I SAM-dependent methyltransferase [Sulfuricaulis sp.]|uniref:class I SAM-dependent methyltransferase n=1 Tax=Sulfuricaulis sp. TaxID=2003553 RepID=UPI0025F78E5F|nr:class I SAM-dependent methyltransferase [Sulfuricaulis sp.]MCR4347784.1 class I SAM-dependent methyltransferase [Sulfuricaulis sp.]